MRELHFQTYYLHINSHKMYLSLHKNSGSQLKKVDNKHLQHHPQDFIVLHPILLQQIHQLHKNYQFPQVHYHRQ